MADLFVMCPECGPSTRLIDGKPKIVEGDAKCKHRQNPLSCPALSPVIENLGNLQRPPPGRAT